MAAVYAPGIPLDATGEGVARTLDHFRPWQDRGVRIFVVKFDDVGFALTPESELRFGKFAPALVGYLRLVRQGLRRRDADAKLYFLPQTYWWTTRASTRTPRRSARPADSRRTWDSSSQGPRS